MPPFPANRTVQYFNKKYWTVLEAVYQYHVINGNPLLVNAGHVPTLTNENRLRLFSLGVASRNTAENLILQQGSVASADQ